MNVQRKGSRFDAIEYKPGTTCGWVVAEATGGAYPIILFYHIKKAAALAWYATTSQDCRVCPAWGNMRTAKEGDWLVSSGDGIVYTYSAERFETDFVRV